VAGARINNSSYLDAGRREIEGRAVGLGVVCEDDGAAAGRDGKAVDIGARRRRQHHARPVVAGEHQRPLDCAGSNNDLARPHHPQALARQRRRGGGAEVVGHTLGERHGAVIVNAERGGARQQPDVFVGLEFLQARQQNTGARAFAAQVAPERIAFV
jgi:hypothetical protein